MKFLKISLIFIVTMLTLSPLLTCQTKKAGREELGDFSQLSVTQAPEWAVNGVLYQVFPRVFTEKGTFKAMESRLDYVRQLGVDIIWLMPVFPIGEEGRKGTLGSPYAVKDFRAVNPEYGTEQDFRDLVTVVHQRGMKVILGIVPNHAANDNILTQSHPDWFMQNERGEFIREVPDWSDIIDFDYGNPDMQAYMEETLIYWVEEFDIDGYRCDIAGMVPYDFWKSALSRLREVKPDIYLLAEWEDPEILLAGFNSDYGWSEFHMMKSIRQGEERTSGIIRLVENKEQKYPRNSLIMRFLENHDEPRSLTGFGAQAIASYTTVLFTLPGIPLIYAGQEMGATEKPSLFEKSVLPWASRDMALEKMIRGLIFLRKQWPCFTTEHFMQLPTASMSGSVGAFLRFHPDSAAVVICNLRRTRAEKIVVTLPDEIREELLMFNWVNYKQPGESLDPENIVLGEIEPFTTLVYLGTKK